MTTLSLITIIYLLTVCAGIPISRAYFKESEINTYGNNRMKMATVFGLLPLVNLYTIFIATMYYFRKKRIAKIVDGIAEEYKDYPELYEIMRKISVDVKKDLTNLNKNYHADTTSTGEIHRGSGSSGQAQQDTD
jgi:hypothetical protein